MANPPVRSNATTDPLKVTTANPATTTYLDGEHESMLTNIDHMHNETRGQTIARLEAALKVARDNRNANLSPLATRTETVTREVTIPTAAELANVAAEAESAAAHERLAPARRQKARVKPTLAKAKAADKARAKAAKAEVAPAPYEA